MEAARRLAAGGKQVIVVTTTPPGGRATVGSLLPSKVWLHHAAATPARPTVDLDELRERGAAIAATVRTTVQQRVGWSRDSLTTAGIEIVHGIARVTAPGVVEVAPPPGSTSAARGGNGAGSEDGDTAESITIETTDIVLATGSEPTFVPGVKPDGERIIAPRHTQHMPAIPSTMVVVGAGVTGVEYASAFAALGCSVTLLASREVLPRFDREYVDQLTDWLRALGVTVYQNTRAKSVESAGGAIGSSRSLSDEDGAVTVTTESGDQFPAASAFIATGRAADLTAIAPLGAAVARTGSAVTVDEWGQTSMDHVWACGDVTGSPLIANRAVHQARRVAASILEGTHGTPPAEPALIEAVFARVQMAQVGACGEAGNAPTTRIPYDAAMLPHIHGTTTPGELKLWTDSNDRVVGAAAIGENAADLLAPVQLAIQHGLTRADLTDTPYAYPTITEIVSS
jgi:dihydrolipoamide dehydrogenase